MTPSGPTRRRVLAGGGLAALAAAAGCLVGDPAGDSDRDGDPDPPGGYARWLPGEAELGTGASEAELGVGESVYAFASLDVARVLEARDRFDEGEYAGLADRFGTGGSLLPRIEGVGRVTGLVADRADLLAVEGSFSAGAAADRLTANGFERAGDRGGFALYAGSGGTFGVRDGAMAGSRTAGEAGGDAARTLLDAHRGTADRLVADDDAARLVEALGDGLNAVGTVTPGPYAGGYDADALSAVGRAVHLEGGTARVEFVLVHDDEGDADPDAALATAREEGGTMGRLRDRSASATGRVVTVSGEADPARLTFDGYTVGVGPDPAATPPAPPRATVEFDYDRSAETLTITHAGGESFTAGNTAALLYGPPEGESLAEWPLPVEAGDAVTVREVTPGDAVVVYWESVAGDRIPLARFAAP